MRSLDPKKRVRVGDKLGRSKHTVNVDKYDLDRFEKLRLMSPEVMKLLEKGESEYEQYPELHRDLFGLLYRYAPEILDEWEISGSYLLNKKIVEAIKEHEDYKKIRVDTRLDEISSLIGTRIVGEEALELVKKLKEEMKKQLEELEKAQQEAEDAQDALDQEGEEGDGPPDPRRRQKEITLEEAKRQLEEAKKNFKDEFKQPQFRQAMNKIVDKLRQGTADIKDTIANWGLSDDETFTKLPYHDKLALVDRLRSGKLKLIAELAGKFKRLASAAQKEKVKRGINETYSVTYGREIDRLLPSERLRLVSDDELRQLKFLADWSEGKTLVYQLRGKEKKYKGPVVLCLDESGSMSGQNEIWSKAVALGLLEICKTQKRSLYVVHFSSNWRQQNMHVNRFLKDGSYTIQDIIDMCSYFEGGGTMFEPPLDKAREMIDLEGEFKKADIIFVTDGEAAVTNVWLNQYKVWKQEKKVSIYTILIDCGYCSSGTAKEFSDRIEQLSKLDSKKNDNSEIAVEVFKFV